MTLRQANFDGQPSAKAALDNLSLLYVQQDVQQSWPQVIEIE
jgi:hypothetical protein